MKNLFINGSPNKAGNTVALAKAAFDNDSYETLALVDYKVYSYGQTFEDDQFEMVLSKMKEADQIVIGSPVYWHSMSGALRNLLDRFYGPVRQGALQGKKLMFLFQGAAPEGWMLEKAEYTMSRFAKLYGMECLGMATTQDEAEKLGQKMRRFPC